MILHRFQALTCSYDSVHRCMCMDCYNALMSKTSDGLVDEQRNHRCRVLDLSIVAQFSELYLDCRPLERK